VPERGAGATGSSSIACVVHEMKADGLPPEGAKDKFSKDRNKLIEQHHRHLKYGTDVMLCFKRFRRAATTISGVELICRIRKGQFDLPKLGLKDTAAHAVWNAILSDR
jgi:transposase-like protein